MPGKALHSSVMCVRLLSVLSDFLSLETLHKGYFLWTLMSEL